MHNFSQLSVKEQEARLLKLAYQSLQAWGLEGELSLIKQRENAVYKLLTSRGERYALRVHRANYHSDAALESEVSWTKALSEFGLGVPSIVPTISGKSFTLEDTGEIDHARQVDLLEWLDGEQIGSVEDGLGEDPVAIQHIYHTIGVIAAQVHNQASAWQPPENFERHAWDTDGLVGEQPLWGQFWLLEALSEEQKSLVLQARQAITEDLQAYGQSANHYSMIHADFVPENFLVDGDMVQMIDFDDAGFGWHLFELATALYFIQDDKHYPVAKQALIDGYRQHRGLSDEQLEKLPLFMAARSLTYLGWVHTRKNTETAIELTPDLIQMSCDATEKYLSRR